MSKRKQGGTLRRLLLALLLGWGAWMLYTRWWPLHGLQRMSGQIETAVNRELVAAGVRDSTVLSQVRVVRSRWGLSWDEHDRTVLLENPETLHRLTNRLAAVAQQHGCRLEHARRDGASELVIGRWFVRFQKIHILTAPPAVTRAGATPPQPVTRTAEVAFVIDDVAYTLEPMDSFAALGVPLTFAILPRDRHCRALAEKAHRLGFPVILHIPMEPLDRAHNDPGGAALTLAMSPQELHDQFEKNVVSIPHVIGINNHMGSAFTQDEGKMTALMPWVKAKHLFFLDSHTVPHSVVCQVAKRFNVPCRVNDTFLDNADDVAAIEAELDGVLKLALRRKQTIAIGHYRRRHLVEALAAKLPEFRANGVTVVALPALYQ